MSPTSTSASEGFDIEEVSPDFDAIVLAGGGSNRMGGLDKLREIVGGVPLLERALDAVRDAKHIVVVGERLEPWQEYDWLAEDPRGAGPAYSVAAGMQHLADAARSDHSTQRSIVLVAGDMPFTATAIPRLLTAQRAHDAAVLTDESGRLQYLVAAWSRRALNARIRDIAPHAAMRALYRDADIATVAAENGEAIDCDTPTALARARTIADNLTL
jgi:molybdopterin-guanine dinucleotide biosynthesis protein A